MKNDEKLKLIIQKVIDNGFLGLKDKERYEFRIYIGKEYENTEEEMDFGKNYSREIQFVWDWRIMKHEEDEFECEPDCCGEKLWFSVNDLIFGKQFLKAYFGEEKQKDLELKVYYGEYEWQYQAYKLVLADDRIDYLYKKL